MPEGLRPSRMILPKDLNTRRQGQILARALLFIPALALLSFTLWRRADSPPSHGGLAEPTEPMKTGTVGLIDGWEGRVVRDGAAPLRLRLETLHPEVTRQAFDAEALRQKLGRQKLGRGELGRGELGRGELGREEAKSAATSSGEPPPVGDVQQPWRLTISVAAVPRAASDEEPTVVIPDLSAIQLVGLEPLVPEQGRAQRDAAGAETATAHDPLRTLLTFYSGPLHEGEACDLVFWGTAPEGSVRAVIPGLGEVELRNQSRSADRSSASIASLDGRQGQRGGAK